MLGTGGVVLLYLGMNDRLRPGPFRQPISGRSFTTPKTCWNRRKQPSSRIAQLAAERHVWHALVQLVAHGGDRPDAALDTEPPTS